MARVAVVVAPLTPEGGTLSMRRYVTSPKFWRGQARRHYIVLSSLLLLGGCVTSGDFGRIRPELVNDDIHDWLGPDAAIAVGGIPSEFPLTDDERRLIAFLADEEFLHG